MSGGGLASDGPNRIFFVTGNGAGTEPGPTASNAPSGNLVESVVRVDVQADGSLKAMDFFAPFNAFHMADADLSGGAAVLLPSQFGTATVPNTAMVVGKEGILYLMDRSKLGGFKMGANNSDAVLSEIPVNGTLRSHAAVWPGDGGYVYVAVTGGDANNVGYRLRAFKYAPNAQGIPSLSLVGVAGVGSTGNGDDFGQYSGSPIVTSDNLVSGSAVVWVTSNTGALRAYSAVPVNGVMNRLIEIGFNDQAKFTKPGIGNGRVYVGTDNGRLVGFGAAASPIVASPVQFGTVTVGQQLVKNAVITAPANQTVTVTAVASSNNAVFTPGASTPALPVTLTGAQTLTVPVTFTPNAATSFVATLNVTTNTGAGTVSLGGTGQTQAAQLAATPQSVAFGGVATGAASTVNVNLQNTGSQALTFGATTAPAAPFSVTTPPTNGQVLAAGATTTVSVNFAPTAVGNFTSNLVINSNGGNITIPLSGTGATPPQMVITPLSLDFGSNAANVSKSLSFTIKNTGGLALVIQKSKPPVASQFVAQTTLAEGSTVAAGQTVTETVALSSPIAGTFNDVWTITGSDTSGVQNVAFTGTVTASLSALPRTGWVASATATGGADVPANAIDASTATRFSTGLAQSNTAPQSFTVDMLTAQSISRVTFDSAGDYARSFQVFTSTDGTNFGTAVATGTGTAASTTVNFAQTTARYVRVQQLTSAGVGAWWSIYDFNVYGTAAVVGDGSAFSRTGWAASASATAGTDVPANAVDASATTRWSSGIAQSATTTQSYTLDMLSAKTFAKLTLDSGGDYARSFQVFVSTDGTTWGTAVATGTGAAALTTVLLPTQTARFIQIRQLTSAAVGAWWSINDLNVYQPGGVSALSRTGWVASGSATGDPPANAVDGDNGTRWSTTAAQVNGQFFQVDMQTARTFRQLTLDAAGSADYPRGYQVFVSADGVAWGTAIASGAPTTPLVTISFAAQTARYIKVVQTGTVTPNWWSLYEFNVLN